VLLLPGVGDDQVAPHQAVVLVRLLHQLNLPVVTPPPGRGGI
jgi:hypothetical protein